MRRSIFFLLLLPLYSASYALSVDAYAPHSVLGDGHWLKLRVVEDGIYKLTYADIRRLGFSDPSVVSVCGYGGWVLSEDFSGTYVDDLPVIPAYHGVDYLLFYGRGVTSWRYGVDPYNYSESVLQFLHELNPYSSYGYYFLTDALPTPELPVTSNSSDSPLLDLHTFDDYQLHERDEVSVNSSGRELFGESFESTLSQSFTFATPGITNDAGLVSIRFISKGNGTVSLSVDDVILFNDGVITQPTMSSDQIYTKGVGLYRAALWEGAKNESTKVTVNYNLSGHVNAHLDYIRLQYKRRLRSYGEPFTFFRSLESIGKASRFVIEGCTSEMLVLDITDATSPKLIESTLSGSELSFTIAASAISREFVLIDLTKEFPVPEVVKEVVNQDLHSLPQTEMVILVQPALQKEAERLALFHREHTGLSVTVVTPEQVYNEFSSGTPDATAIRRFMKMFYDRRSSEADAPRFLLLFGDGTYDNRGLTSMWRSVSMDNFLLTYQTVNSLNAQSYVMEDYFGFLSDGEGLSHSSSNILLGIGRFPVRTVSEARAVVDKVIAYMENSNAGNWKNNLCFVADDGSSADGYSTEYMSQADRLTQYLEENHPEFLTGKIFMDAFKKSNIGGKASYPDVESSISKQLKEGTLLIDYTGHGSSEAWSDEHVMTNAFIRQSTYPYLPLWITATCDFTPFDGFSTSAGENVFLSPSSGGIGLFTTTRVAYSSTNFEINKRLIENLFNRKDGRRMTLGEVVRETKQTYKNTDRARFLLIGDPALTLTYPDHRIELTEINGAAIPDTLIAFRAQERITVRGEVYLPDGTRASDFNGSLSVTVLDSEQSISTLDNNRTGVVFEYKDYPNTIQKINGVVSGGVFSFSFVVPKDISYADLPGKMSLYALSDGMDRSEAHGIFKNFRVGGTSSNTEGDVVGPEIRALYLNSDNFVDGGCVNETPLFVSVLWDQSGINIGGSSLGHDITLTIDNTPSLSYNLNAYLDALPGSESENLSVVRFPLPELPLGEHHAEFRVWDVLNNSTTHEFSFEVSSLRPSFSVVASPSPASESVNFVITHDRPESLLEASVYVHDVSGQLVWRYSSSGLSGMSNIFSITWDLRNASGGRLKPGIYFYRVSMRSGGSSASTRAAKLVITSSGGSSF